MGGLNFLVFNIERMLFDLLIIDCFEAHITVKQYSELYYYSSSLFDVFHIHPYTTIILSLRKYFLSCSNKSMYRSPAPKI